MTAETIGGLVDGAIPLIGGLLATAYAFNLIGGTRESRPREILRVLGPLVLLFGALRVGMVLMQAPKEADLRALFVSAANSQAGTMVDSDTRLVAVVDVGDRVRFEYQVVTWSKAELDADQLQTALSASMRGSLCLNKPHREALERFGPFETRYVDKVGEEVLVLSMVSGDCP